MRKVLCYPRMTLVLPRVWKFLKKYKYIGVANDQCFITAE